MANKNEKQKDKNKDKEDLKTKENSAAFEDSVTEAEVVNEKGERDKKVHHELTLDFDNLPSDVTIGEVQEEARIIEDENESVESPLDKYIRKHREVVETAKSQFGQLEDSTTNESGQSSETESELSSTAVHESEPEEAINSANSASSSSEKFESAESVVNSDIQDSESTLDSSSSVEASSAKTASLASESAAVEVAKSETASSAETISSSASILDSMSVTGSDIAASSTRTEENAQSTDQSMDPVIVASDDEAESEESAETAETPQSASSDALEGELLTNNKSRVIFPVPMAAEKVAEDLKADSAEKETAAADSVVPASSTMNSASATSAASSSSNSSTAHSATSTVESQSVVQAAHPDGSNLAAEAEHPNRAADSEKKKSHKVPIIIGVAAVAAIAVGTTFAVNGHHEQQKSNTVQTKQNKEKAAFNTAYNAFFTDSKHTALKNSNFSELDKLKSKLSTLSNDKSAYQTDKTKYDNLSSDISAIDAVNGIFEKPAITDGKLDKSVKIKNNVTIPQVSSKNSTINSLLQEAVAMAKSQQNQAKAASSASAASSAAAASTASSQAAAASSAAASSNTAAAPSAPADSGSSSSSAGTSNSAYDWAPGVLDNFLSTLRSRGTISGNNYTLVPAGIHTTNGNIYGHNGVILGTTAPIVAGYYKLYGADGQYLVTVNCKTGYFWGTTNPPDYD